MDRAEANPAPPPAPPALAATAAVEHGEHGTEKHSSQQSETHTRSSSPGSMGEICAPPPAISTDFMIFLRRCPLDRSRRRLVPEDMNEFLALHLIKTEPISGLLGIATIDYRLELDQPTLTST